MRFNQYPYAALAAILCSVVVGCGSDPAPASAPASAPDGQAATADAAAPPRDAGPAKAADAGASPPPAPEQNGRWRRLNKRKYRQPLTAAQREEIERLKAIGYLQGSRRAGDLFGVTRHDPERAYQGFNLYNSGHAPSAILTDMHGAVLHEWAASFEQLWPGQRAPGDLRQLPFWRRVILLPGGELLVIFDGHGIAKIDKNSQLVWKSLNHAHHDVDVGPDGALYVLTRVPHVVPRINKHHPIVEDFVAVLDERGKELRRVSLIEAFERSRRYRRIFRKSKLRRGDIFHTNTVELLDGRLAKRHRAFAAGNVLVSIRYLDAIAVVDLDRRKVVWAATGVFHRQHEPTILENGNLLLFDNLGHAPYSSVQEYDPISMRLKWEYRGSKQRPFYTHTCGVAQRLPNGNTLITESDAGRAFEVTRDKQIVWEFFNPHRAGKQRELIGTLFEVRRLPLELDISWAARPQGGEPPRPPTADR